MSEDAYCQRILSSAGAGRKGVCLTKIRGPEATSRETNVSEIDYTSKVLIWVQPGKEAAESVVAGNPVR